MPASLPSFSGEIAMKNFSELAGLIAGLALFLGTLVIAEAYVARSDIFHSLALAQIEE